MGMRRWTILETKALGTFRLKRVESPSGQRVDYVVVSYPEVVAVLPLTADEQVVLINQYRHAAEEPTLEIPGGVREAGESIEQCARRELEEETGYRAGQLDPLLSFHPSSANIEQVVHLCVACGLDRVGAPAHSELLEEETSIALIPFASLLEQVLRGEIRDAATVIAVLRYAMKRPNLSSRGR
jgi:ADP-ribose pyrophosphatase